MQKFSWIWYQWAPRRWRSYHFRQYAKCRKKVFKGLDAVHHHSGNYNVTINGDAADVNAYAIASHYKKETTQGAVREFIGSYDFHLIKKENGLRIDKFRYNLKYTDGNLEQK